jgi:hypothetical protein
VTLTPLLCLVTGAACGGLINGLSGTGNALFQLTFPPIVPDPVTAVTIVALMSVLAGLQGPCQDVQTQYVT